ncbi:hypothetical protein P8R50_12195 [Methanobacterium formicicum]|nr:hypothetical protein [Methanobacterium formicicum]MDG3548615.1 hypothetical protein [Methanobacterium formicicum]
MVTQLIFVPWLFPATMRMCRVPDSSVNTAGPVPAYLGPTIPICRVRMFFCPPASMCGMFRRRL